jgi:hypothetical protein
MRQQARRACVNTNASNYYASFAPKPCATMLSLPNRSENSLVTIGMSCAGRAPVSHIRKLIARQAQERINTVLLSVILDTPD